MTTNNIVIPDVIPGNEFTIFENPDEFGGLSVDWLKDHAQAIMDADDRGEETDDLWAMFGQLETNTAIRLNAAYAVCDGLNITVNTPPLRTILELAAKGLDRAVAYGHMDDEEDEEEESMKALRQIYQLLKED